MSFGLPRVSSLRNGRQLRLPRFVHQRRSGNRQGPLQLRRNACAERIAGTELPGLSSFHKDGCDAIFHTYSRYARGGEELVGTLMILDRAPKGGNEKTTMDFVRRHHEYERKPTLHDGCA